MPIVYEHWRPDTNECFYVGISIRADKIAHKRANSFKRPGNKHHTAVVKKLEHMNVLPFVKIIHKSESPECVKTIEKIKIAIWRSKIGNSLTNITDGGDGGPIMIGENHPNYGKPVGKPGSKSMLGKFGSEHNRHGSTPWNKGKKYNLEEYPNMRVLLKGSKHPSFGRKPWHAGLPKERHPCFGKRRALTQEQAEHVKLLLADGRKTQKEIAEIFGISKSVVSVIKTGRRYN